MRWQFRAQISGPAWGPGCPLSGGLLCAQGLERRRDPDPKCRFTEVETEAQREEQLAQVTQSVHGDEGTRIQVWTSHFLLELPSAF